MDAERRARLVPEVAAPGGDDVQAFRSDRSELRVAVAIEVRQRNDRCEPREAAQQGAGLAGEDFDTGSDLRLRRIRASAGGKISDSIAIHVSQQREGPSQMVVLLPLDAVDERTLLCLGALLPQDRPAAEKEQNRGSPRQNAHERSIGLRIYLTNGQIALDRSEEARRRPVAKPAVERLREASRVEVCTRGHTLDGGADGGAVDEGAEQGELWSGELVALDDELLAAQSEKLLAGLRQGHLHPLPGASHGGVVAVDRVTKLEELQADHRHEPGCGPALRRDRAQLLLREEGHALHTGAIEDLADGTLQTGEIDEQVWPVDRTWLPRVVAIGPGLFQVAREGVRQAREGVAAGWMCLEVGEGQATEGLLADRLLQHGKGFAETLQQPRVVGIGIHREPLRGGEALRAADHALELSGPEGDLALGLLGFDAALDSGRMGDDGLEPVLDDIEVAELGVGLLSGALLSVHLLHLRQDVVQGVGHPGRLLPIPGSLRAPGLLGPGERSLHVLPGLQHLRVDDREGGDPGVPLQERRDPPGELMRQTIELPHRVDHVVVVRIDQVRCTVRVTGQVELHHALVRHGADELLGVHVVVEARDVDVVDVEQQATIGVLGHARDEFPLAQRGVGEGDVAARVLEHEGPLEDVLHDADALDDVLERRLVERNRQQVVGVAAGHTCPADVVGHPVRTDRVRERLQFSEVVEVEGVGGADRQGDAVHHDAVALGDLLEDIPRAAAGVDEVFGDDLEPVDIGLVLEDVREVHRAQPDAQTQVGMSQTG